jgi:hypothetical protein
MGLKDIFSKIKKAFYIKRDIVFEEVGVTIRLEALTSAEELRVLEACKDLEGAIYIEGIKKHSLAYSIRKINDMEFSGEYVDYEDENGKPATESRHLFMLKQVEEWPSTLRDVLFGAFSNLQEELEHMITQKAKFERFVLKTPEPEPAKRQEAGVPEGFRKIVEPTDQSEDEVELVNKIAQKEIEDAQSEIDRKNLG